MISRRATEFPRVLLITAVFASLTAMTSLADSSGTSGLILQGTVLDADTKEPIEGAYVVASYKIQRSGMAATASFCVKTLGTRTGKDGRYHFPVEKRDGRSPFTTNAIKPGYFWVDTFYADPIVWKRQDAAAYSNRDIHLRKQDPAKPTLRYSDMEEVCPEAPTRQAAAAGTEFLKIVLSELAKYPNSEQKQQGVSHFIHRHESFPDQPASKRP